MELYKDDAPQMILKADLNLLSQYQQQAEEIFHSLRRIEFDMRYHKMNKAEYQKAIIALLTQYIHLLSTEKVLAKINAEMTMCVENTIEYASAAITEIQTEINKKEL